MEYRSPLPSSFNLDHCDLSQDSPMNSSSSPLSQNSFEGPSIHGPRPFRRFPNYKNFNSPKKSWDGRKRQWNKTGFADVHISQYYHPSMLMDPWKELLAKQTAAAATSAL